MARKPKDVIEKAAMLSTDAMRRAVTARATKVVPIEQILKPRAAAAAPEIHRQISSETARRVFISYSQRDRALAKALARYLEYRGIDVWWDFRLYPGSKFRQRIMMELDKARTVIVIWSKHSVQSDFVIDEAGEGKDAGKLVATHVSDFDTRQIPLGFRQLHSEPLVNRAAILEALAEHGIFARVPRQDRPAQSRLA